MIATFAILFLDDLDMQQCDCRAALNAAVDHARGSGQPFLTLKRTDRQGREVWQVQTTDYLDRMFKPPSHAQLSLPTTNFVIPTSDHQ